MSFSTKVPPTDIDKEMPSLHFLDIHVSISARELLHGNRPLMTLNFWKESH